MSAKKASAKEAVPDSEYVTVVTVEPEPVTRKKKLPIGLTRQKRGVHLQR